MTLFAIFLVCAVGTNKCDKFYTELPRPPGITAADIPDDAMLKSCKEGNREDHSFDNP